MSSGWVTLDTGKSFIVWGSGLVAHLADHILVAADAVLLYDAFTARVCGKGFVEVLQGEGFGVGVAVEGFGEVFAEEVVGYVAVVAGGNSVVAGMLPGTVVFAHDVAVGAGYGFVAKV